MMMQIVVLFLTGLWLLSPALSLAADTTSGNENLDKLLNNLRNYVEVGNYPKALEEMSWIQRDLEKRDLEATLKYFPDEFNGFKGEPATTQSTLGVTTIERRYKKASQTINVSLLGGGGIAGGAMGGLAALGRFAMMQQQQGGQGKGQEMFRLDGRTAILEEKGKSADLTVHLESGGILKFEMKRDGDVGTLRGAAQAFPIADLDVYRRGSK